MFEPNYVTFFIVIICDILRRNNSINPRLTKKSILIEFIKKSGRW